MGSFDNYLTVLTVPDLNDVNFAQDFTTMVENINNNFKKIVSAPYLKGDKGDNVRIEKEYVYHGTTHKFTAFGVKLVNTIYGGDIIVTTNDDYNSLITKLDAINDKLGGTVNSCEQLNPIKNSVFENITIDVFYDIYDYSKSLVSIYFFLDSRNNMLDSINDEEKRNYIDRSCGVYGKFINNNWNLNKYNVIPTLYFDTNIDEFCWMVNGQQSGITAQGLTGADGTNANVYVCRGVEVASIIGNNNQSIPTRILINEVISGSTETLVEGSLAAVWFDSEPVDAGKLNGYAGSPETGYHYINIDDDTSSPYNNMHMYVYNESVWEDEGEIHPNQLMFYENAYYYWDGTNIVPCTFHSNPNVAFGIVEKQIVDASTNTYSYYIKYNRNVDLGAVISSTSFRSILNEVGKKSTDSTFNDVRGIYLRDSITNSAPTNNEAVHLAYTNEDGSLNIRKVTYNDTRRSSDISDDISGDNSTLNVNYSTVNFLGQRTDTQKPIIKFSAADGVTINNGVVSGSGSRTHCFMNLVGNNGRLIIKETETAANVEGAMTFIPFGNVYVGPSPITFAVDRLVLGSYLQLGLPFVGFISNISDGVAAESKSHGIIPSGNSNTNYSYIIINKQSATCSASSIYVNLPNVAGDTSRIKYSYGDEFIVSITNKFPSWWTNTIIGTYTSRLKIQLAIQNTGMHLGTGTGSDIIQNNVYIVKYIVSPYSTSTNESATYDNGTPKIASSNRLFYLLSHAEPQNWTSAVSPQLSCNMKFFLICNPNNRSSKVILYPYNPEYNYGFVSADGSITGSMYDVLGITTPRINNYKNWHWVLKESTYTPWAHWNDGDDPREYGASVVWAQNIWDDDNAGAQIGGNVWIKADNSQNCPDTFSSVLRYYNSDLSINARNLEAVNLLRTTNVCRFEAMRCDLNDSTPRLVISNLPDSSSTNSFAFNYFNSQDSTADGFFSMTEQEAEWLYINNQPLQVGTNRVALSYDKTKYTEKQIESGDDYDSQYVDTASFAYYDPIVS